MRYPEHLFIPLSAALLAAAQCQPYNTLAFRAPVVTASGLAAQPIFANLTTPRGVAIDSHDNILVVERGLGLTAFTEHEPTCAGWFRSVVITSADFTQGIQVHRTDLYVSTTTTVFRYVYNPATRSVSGTPVTVVTGIPPDGELTTRPILLDPASNPTRIFVSSPLEQNIDPTARDPASLRSQVRTFSLPPSSPPASYSSGTLVAYGIRNPASFAVKPAFSTLWIIENSASIDDVARVTPDFVNDNPADELERVNLSGPAKFYGFPDCTTLWNGDADPVGVPEFVGLPPGTQFSLELSDVSPSRDDVWCRNTSNNAPPRLSFQAHSVPLDIKFYTPGRTGTSRVGLPLRWAGDAFVSFHGSFDRDPPTGYSVVRVPFHIGEPNASSTAGAAGYETIVRAADLSTCSATAANLCIRPVGLGFASNGRLFVSSDATGELFFIARS